MKLKLLTVLMFVVLLDGIYSESDETSEVVSTTQSAVSSEEENNSTVCLTLDDINYRLKEIELQIMRSRTNFYMIDNMLRKQYDLENLISEIDTKLESATQRIISEIKEQFENQKPAKSCQEVFERGNNLSQVYEIRPKRSIQSFEVFCNMDTNEGGWIQFLNRFDGSEDFFLTWDDYKHGFGDLSGEYWLGLEYLYQITNSEENQLLVELTDWNDTQVYALYDRFKIGSESEGYVLKVLGNYSGDAGDSMNYHVDEKFSTKDRDNDHWSDDSCAHLHKGAWWYYSCYASQLTGTYFNGEDAEQSNTEGIAWKSFHEITYSLKAAKMMVRPRRK